MYTNQRKKNSIVWKSHVILKSCSQCCLVYSTLHSSRKNDTKYSYFNSISVVYNEMMDFPVYALLENPVSYIFNKVL